MPPEGLGLSHSRLRILWPSPHVLEHLAHGPHEPHAEMKNSYTKKWQRYRAEPLGYFYFTIKYNADVV